MLLTPSTPSLCWAPRCQPPAGGRRPLAQLWTPCLRAHYACVNTPSPSPVCLVSAHTVHASLSRGAAHFKVDGFLHSPRCLGTGVGLSSCVTRESRGRRLTQRSRQAPEIGNHRTVSHLDGPDGALGRGSEQRVWPSRGWLCGLDPLWKPADAIPVRVVGLRDRPVKRSLSLRQTPSVSRSGT